jgi:fatty-acyl-CoA synthase
MNGPALRHRLPVAALIERAGRHGDREVVSHRVEGDLHRLTRTELIGRARRLAAALAAAGLAAGERVATLAWTGHRHLEIAFAACGSGAILQALDPGLHPDRILRMSLESGARVLCFDLSFMPIVEEIAPRLPAATLLVALTDRANMPVPPASRRLLCYEELLAGAPDADDWPALDDEPLASSMSAPVAMPPLPAATEAFEAGDGAPEVVLAVIPMWHADGPGVVRSAWGAGATLVFAGPWLDGGSLRELAESEGATIVAAPQPLWLSLRACLDREGTGMPHLRRSILAGDSGTITATGPLRGPRAA